jgi:hypothetical protein
LENESTRTVPIDSFTIDLPPYLLQHFLNGSFHALIPVIPEREGKRKPVCAVAA